MTDSTDTVETLPEYRDNPFISNLRPPMSLKKMASELVSLPTFNPVEPSYPAHLRKHCVMRLRRFFLPMTNQLYLCESFDILLRQGYIGRNPSSPEYIQRLQNAAERLEAKNIQARTRHQVFTTAATFSVIGCAGAGKSTALNKTLSLYTQCIEHREPFSLVQITWLKLECPSVGGIRQLCIQFFAAMDGLLGTDYMRRYVGSSTSVDILMPRMALVAELHALGVLVIDEIQHLTISGVSHEALLNFLVTLVNVIGVPVILVGTPKALRVLQKDFRQARRADGVGSKIWDRMKNDETWKYFIDTMWQYQWLKEPTPINENVRNEMYNICQGIIDIAVNFFILVQLSAITRGIKKGAQEPSLSIDFLRQTAQRELKIVKPMLDALRRNDTVALMRYEDLRSFHEHVAQVMNEVLTQTGANDVIVVSSEVPTVANEQPDALASSLKAIGLADDVARVLIENAKRENPSGDPLLLLGAIMEKLKTQPPRVKKPKLVKPHESEQPEGDLRRILREGGSQGKTAYESLRDAGMVQLLRRPAQP